MEQTGHNKALDSAEEASEPRRARGARRTLWIVIGIVLGMFALLVVTDVATSSPALCNTCHEIQPRHTSWAQSPHAEVTCVECHQPATQWYQLPTRLMGRAELLGRDFAAHVGGDYQDPVDRKVAGRIPVADENCLKCHDPAREATSGLRILIDHGEHARLNGSCISCHVRVAHPIETRGNQLSFMGQCFTCHGMQKGAKAPGDCDVCHPKTYELVPASHSSQKWKRDHGDASKTDPKLCTMCHTKKSCDGCHGVAMPHPDGWQESGGHSKVAQLNRAVCERCHGARRDMCTMCHHKSYTPAKGTWAKQHFLEVRDRGAAFCFECHSPVYCVKCHVRGPSGEG